MRSIIFGVIIFGVFAFASQTADEAVIRFLIARATPSHPVQYADDSIFVSEAYPRPLIGAKALDQAVKEENTNGVKLQVMVYRLEISKAGDMAYEFSSFHYSVERDGKLDSFDGSLLRVWKKVDERWRVAASFARPNQ